MTPEALLAELRRRGIELTPEGDRLHYRAPLGTLNGELRALIIEQKPALFRLLNPPEPSNDGELERRVVAFRHQVEAWAGDGRTGIPLLILPEASEPRCGACISCSTLIDRGHFRCELCRRAVELVLGLRPEEPSA